MIGRREFAAAAFSGAGLLALDIARVAEGGDIIAKPKDKKDIINDDQLVKGNQTITKDGQVQGNLYVEKDIILDSKSITKLIEDKINTMGGLLKFATVSLKGPVSNLPNGWTIQGPPDNKKFLQCDFGKDTLVKGAWYAPSRGQATPEATVLAGKDVFPKDDTYNYRILVEFKGAAELQEFLNSQRELRVDYVFV